MTRLAALASATLLLAVSPDLVAAHPGHGWGTGALHYLANLDHGMVLMVTFGILGVVVGRRALTR